MAAGAMKNNLMNSKGESMPPRDPTSVRSRINAITGAGRRTARSTSPVGNQVRAMRSASVFLTQAPTARMRTVARRRSLGGAGG